MASPRRPRSLLRLRRALPDRRARPAAGDRGLPARDPRRLLRRRPRTRRDPLQEEREDAPVRRAGALARDHRAVRRCGDPRRTRDQAGKLLQQLTGYIKRSPELREQLRITQRVVHCDRTDGKVAVIAADSDTLDGWGGTLALVDELGRHKSEENFGLLRDGLGPRDGRLVAFSTAGDDEDSALGRIRIRAHGIPGFGPAGDNPKHKIGRADGFAFHEWSLGAGDDTDDLALVKMANPASWLDESELRARKESPSMQPWQWQRFTCGLWVAGEHSAISARTGSPARIQGARSPPMPRA